MDSHARLGDGRCRFNPALGMIALAGLCGTPAGAGNGLSDEVVHRWVLESAESRPVVGGPWSPLDPLITPSSGLPIDEEVIWLFSLETERRDTVPIFYGPPPAVFEMVCCVDCPFNESIGSLPWLEVPPCDVAR